MPHANLRVRFYPGREAWACVVQRLGGDGMPLGPDVLSANGATRDAALQAAILVAKEEDVQAALRALVDP